MEECKEFVVIKRKVNIRLCNKQAQRIAENQNLLVLHCVKMLRSEIEMSTYLNGTFIEACEGLCYFALIYEDISIP